MLLPARIVGGKRVGGRRVSSQQLGRLQHHHNNNIGIGNGNMNGNGSGSGSGCGDPSCAECGDGAVQYGKYVKAFVAWSLFSIGGYWTIPEDWMPLAAHSVGFGFYLLITTNHSRWLLPLAAGMAAYVALVQTTIPAEWYTAAGHILGHSVMAAFAVGVVWYNWRRSGRPPRAVHLHAHGSRPGVLLHHPLRGGVDGAAGLCRACSAECDAEVPSSSSSTSSSSSSASCSSSSSSSSSSAVATGGGGDGSTATCANVSCSPGCCLHEPCAACEVGKSDGGDEAAGSPGSGTTASHGASLGASSSSAGSSCALPGSGQASASAIRSGSNGLSAPSGSLPADGCADGAGAGKGDGGSGAFANDGGERSGDSAMAAALAKAEQTIAELTKSLSEVNEESASLRSLTRRLTSELHAEQSKKQRVEQDLAKQRALGRERDTSHARNVQNLKATQRSLEDVISNLRTELEDRKRSVSLVAVLRETAEAATQRADAAEAKHRETEAELADALDRCAPAVETAEILRAQVAERDKEISTAKAAAELAGQQLAAARQAAARLEQQLRQQVQVNQQLHMQQQQQMQQRQQQQQQQQMQMQQRQQFNSHANTNNASGNASNVTNEPQGWEDGSSRPQPRLSQEESADGQTWGGSLFFNPNMFLT